MIIDFLINLIIAAAISFLLALLFTIFVDMYIEPMMRGTKK